MKNKQVKQMMIDAYATKLKLTYKDLKYSYFHNAKMIVTGSLEGVIFYNRHISLTANQLKGK